MTVGTSRGDSDLVDNASTRAIAEVGADPSTMSYSLLVAPGLRPGHRGRQRHDPVSARRSPQHTTMRVVRKTGVAEDLTSRADSGAELSGSK